MISDAEGMPTASELCCKAWCMYHASLIAAKEAWDAECHTADEVEACMYNQLVIHNQAPPNSSMAKIYQSFGFNVCRVAFMQLRYVKKQQQAPGSKST